MKPYLRREIDEKRTAGLGFKLIEAVIEHNDYSEIVRQLKSIDLNTFRIGRVSKWKALYNWILFCNEKGFKEIYPDADYNAVSITIRKLCKEIARNEI